MHDTNTKELFERIIIHEKWYAGIKIGERFMTPQYANKVIKRFYSGTLKLSTLQIVFRHFDFDIKEIVWHLK